MVNMIENDRLGYQLALTLAAEHGETITVDTLRRNGPPPYFGDGLTMKYEAYKDVLFPSMGSPKLILGVPLMPMFSPEYGLVDKMNFTRGFLESHTVVYPQLQGLDFIESAPRLEVPVYFLVGRHKAHEAAPR